MLSSRQQARSSKLAQKYFILQQCAKQLRQNQSQGVREFIHATLW